MTAMHRPMPINEISFGVVERAIMVGDTKMLRGTELSHDVLARMPPANRNALIENRFISVFPKGVTVRHSAAAPDVVVPVAEELREAQGEMHIISKGFGKWDVVQGTLVGVGLSREEALAMAEKSQARAAPVNQTASTDAAPAAPAKKGKRPRTSKRAPAAAPGEPQKNGPIEG